MSAPSPLLQLDLRLARAGFELSLAFELRGGARMALIGANGSGKSTILAAIAGVLDPSEGNIRFEDSTWFEHKRALSLTPPHRSCALVFQSGALFPHLSALENIAYGLRAKGIAKDEARDDARRWLERVALQRSAEQLPRSLSGGQARVVALVRALATRPGLLLLDEPFAGLDPIARAYASDLLLEASADFSGALIWASHELRPLRAHTSSVARIEASTFHPPCDWDEALADPESTHLAAMVKAQSP